MSGKNKLRFYISACMMSTMLASCSCSSDDSSSSAVTTVVIDSSVPGLMQVGETAEGSVALSSTVTSLTSIDSEDIREITMADTSSCSPKLTISPSSLMVTVDGDAETFDVTAPEGNCLHTVTFSGTGVSTSTNTSDVNVITDQAVVTVGLYDTEGAETVTVIQGGTVYVKFSPPEDWEGVTAEQSYIVSANTDGVTITNSPCSLTPPTTTACQVTVVVSEDLAVGEYTLSFLVVSGTDVPLDISSISFNVESAANPMAYVVNEGTGVVDKCSIENNDLTECDNADVDDGDITNAQSMTSAEVGGSYHLYIVRPGSESVSSCALNDEGEFIGGSCISSNIPGVDDEIRYIAVQDVDDSYYAYITDYGSQIIGCDVNSESGEIETASCTTYSGGDLDAPEGIATAPIGGVGVAATAYVADNGADRLRECGIDSDGGMQGGEPCTADDDSVPVVSPLAVAAKEINGAWYVFVTSENDDIYTCRAAQDGSITNCLPDNIPANIDNPTGIAIVEIDSEFYAYVTNNAGGNNTVSSCLITQATGLIENGCKVAGENFNGPYGITIIGLP